MFHFIEYLHHLDINILKEINLERYTFLDGTFVFITKSASPITYAVPCILLLFAFMQKNMALFKQVLFIVSSILCSAFIATLLKYTINRPRPFLIYSFIQKVSEGGSPSFPSGHTCDAFVAATCISIIYPKWQVIVPFYLWAFAVAYSRIDLGVHYPSDVLGGILIGTGSALFCYYHWFLKKHSVNLNTK